MVKHARFGGSNCARWMSCHASIRLTEGRFSPESEAAKEGTLAHELAAGWLSYQRPPEFLDAEMREHVRGYVDFVESIPGYLHIELPVSFGKDYLDMFGTADAVIQNTEKKELTVVDFKYGKGVYVSAEDNKQLRFYALAAMKTLKAQPATVRVIIYQPRCGDNPIREETFSIIDLLEFEVDLYAAYAAAKEPNAPTVMGDHCKFCPALVDCPAHVSAAMDAFNDESGGSLTLSEKLQMIEPLTRWIKSVEEKAFFEAVEGREPEGFKLVEKQARRKWRDEDAVLAALDELIREDDLDYTDFMSVKTPAQIEKIAGKEFVDSLTVKESSGLTLVSSADKRPAVRPHELLAADFENLNGE